MASRLSCLQLEHLFYLQFFLLTEDHLGWQIWFGASRLPHPLLPVRPLVPLLQLPLETHASLARALLSPSAARVEEHGTSGFAETTQIIAGLASCCFPPVMRLSLAKRWFHGPGSGCRPFVSRILRALCQSTYVLVRGHTSQIHVLGGHDLCSYQAGSERRTEEGPKDLYSRNFPLEVVAINFGYRRVQHPP